MRELITTHDIGQKIYLLRGHKVMIDRDLADLYRVPTKVLNQVVKRHKRRFPEDFMFHLNKSELENWRSQIVTSNPKAKMGLRRSPLVFTEQGVAMLSSVLNSERAIQVNIAVMRAFVKLRKLVAPHKELARKLVDIERGIKTHNGQIRSIFDAIRQLMEPPAKPRRGIGFKP